MVGLALLYLPSLHDLFTGIWAEDEQFHGPIVLVISLWLLQRNWAKMEAASQGEQTSAWGWPLVVIALLVDLVPDETQRQQRLALVQADVAKAMPPADTTQQALNEARRSEYKRREAAILADYQTRPEAQRNPAQLEAALEEARRAVYAPAN